MNQSLRQYLDTAITHEVKRLENRLNNLAAQPAATPAEGKATADNYAELHALNSKVTSLKTQLTIAREEIERLKQPPVTSTQLAKITTSGRTAYSTAKAAYQEAIKQVQREYDLICDLELQSIAERTSKALERSEFKKALSGSYQDAVRAINSRKNFIQQHGVDVVVGYSGHTCKGLLHDQNELETFEFLLSEELEIAGQSYRITKAEMSQINSSNLYHLQPIRHSNR